MSRKKTNMPRPVNSGRWRKRNVMIVIAVGLSLFASWTLLAYSGALDSVLRQKKKAGGEVSIQNFNSNSPSKEYVYAGGRLIATEEPGSAQGKINPVAVTASNTGAGFSTSMAVDGALNTFWSSGGYPVQWIQLDLGQSYSVSQIRLNVSQYPAGLTTHEIYAGPQSQTLSLLTTLSGSTQGGQWLEVNLSQPAVNVRYLKINTTSSPSWVSWSEIEVYGTPSGLIKLNPISVTASNTGSGFSTSMATDSNVNTFWSSGGAPVQWIQLDLGQSYSVSQIRLNVTQYPAGQTIHEVYGGATPQSLSLLRAINGVTQGGQWIEPVFSPAAANVRYVKINTTASPSWVAWTEIEVYGTQ